MKKQIIDLDNFFSLEAKSLLILAYIDDAIQEVINGEHRKRELMFNRYSVDIDINNVHIYDDIFFDETAPFIMDTMRFKDGIIAAKIAQLK